MSVSDSARLFGQRYAAIQTQTLKARNDPARQPFREAAAVLSRFQPTELKPVGTQPGNSFTSKGWNDFLVDCIPVASKTSSGWWQLRDDVRRETLKRMSSRPRMKAASAANTPPSDDELQNALTAAIAGMIGPLAEKTREQLIAVLTVRTWFGGILEGLPSDSDIRRVLGISDILTPLKRLAGGDRFVGRKSEIESLCAYIGVEAKSLSTVSRAWHFVRKAYYDVTQHPPLLITGPGGVGKSSLVARLILDHSERFDAPDALPFAYLDLDRAELDPSKPLSLVAGACAQLMVEWPQMERQFRSLIERITPLLGARASLYERTRGVASSDKTISEFAMLLKEGSTDRPVLFVIDTFEEAQYLGFDVVQGIANLLAELQKSANMLRIVLAGRADLRDQTSAMPTQNLVLGDLSMEEAGELLHTNIKGSTSSDTKLMEEIISLVGRNPLSLKLAATVINQQGLGQLRAVETRNLLMLRVKVETVQARLYGRILAHIGDNDIRQLVKPGLLVRRLTAEVIREILAVPCGISMTDPNLASDLIFRLENQVALFFRDIDGSYRHRPDVRRLMLKDLASEISASTIRDVHNRAVAFYEKQPAEPIPRAEEIYHRLMRGDDPASIGPRWIPGMENYLRTALEEVPTAAQIWLSSRLGVTPDRSILKRAELGDWETITALSVRRLISTGNSLEALKALSARLDRSDTSPLFVLESEAYRLQGSLETARKTAEAGLTSSARAGDIALQCDLLVQLSLIEETAGNPAPALARINDALAVPSTTRDLIEMLRLTVTRIRLLRKLGEERDDERHDAIDKAIALLSPEVSEQLNQQPALLREVVAELGRFRPELLNQALEVIGLQTPGRLAHALGKWDGKLSSGSGGPSELAQRAGLQDSADPHKWEKYIEESGNQISSNISNWHTEMGSDSGVDEAVVESYRSEVESALNPGDDDLS